MLGCATKLRAAERPSPRPRYNDQVGFFKRLFSADYRAAVSAEAAGDLELAAERYALAGHADAAVRVHLARADRAGSRNDEIAALRDALHWAARDSDGRRRSARALGRALLAKSRAEGVATDRDRERVREAGALLIEAGEYQEAGSAFEMIGDSTGAAAAYRQGGLVDRLEKTLALEDAKQRRARELRQAYADYELYMRTGDREAAIVALRTCVSAAESAREYRRLLDELESRRVGGGRLQLQLRRGGKITITATETVSLGRDPLCDMVLRSAGVSRRHANIRVASEGASLTFSLIDAGSRNGTRLSDIVVHQATPLTDNGRISLGDECDIAYRVGVDHLYLDIDSGLDRGQRAILTRDGVEVDLAVAGLAGTIVFRDGRPIVHSGPDGLTLNGESLTAGEVQLLHGDRIDLDDAEIEVP